MTPAPSPGGPSWQHQPAATFPADRPASSSFFQWLRGLDITRAPDRWVGGVAGGVARRTGLDLALVRGLIVILSVFGGIGVLLYGLAWALLPEPDGRIHVEEAGRRSWTSGLTGAAALVAVGLLRPNLPFLGDGGAGGLLWTLFWIGAVALLVYWLINRSDGRAAHRVPETSPEVGPAPPFGPQPFEAAGAPRQEQGGDTLPYPLPYQPGRAAWSGASSYPGPAYVGPLPPIPPEKSARSRPPRPSGSATALLLGGAITIAAVLLALDYVGVVSLAGAAVVAFAAAGIVLALGVVALGARGHTSGVVGFSAAVATAGALVASFGTAGGTWVVAQDSRTTPSSLRTAAEGYSVMAAQTTIDLGDLPAPSRDVTVPVNSLVSDVTVIVPADVPVEVRTRMALGSADAGGRVLSDGTSSRGAGSDGGVLELTRGALNPDATGAALILDVRGALSDVTIVAAGDAGSTSFQDDDANPTGEAP